MTQKPACYPMWVEAFLDGDWTSDLDRVSAGVCSVEQADERVRDLLARGPRWRTRYRLVRPDGAVLEEIDLTRSGGKT